MLTQSELIEAARAAIARREGRAAPVTNYRVGKLLGITSAYMAQLSNGQGIMSAELAHKLAGLAEVDPAYAMACIEAERAARDSLETSGTWRAIAQSLAGKAASILLAACIVGSGVQDARGAGFPGNSSPSPAREQLPNLYIMLNRVRRVRDRFMSLRQQVSEAVTAGRTAQAA